MAKRTLVLLLLIAIGVPALAAGPKALSILVNDTPFAGKALWYKDRVYVSLEDLARTMNATYTYDARTGHVRVTTGAPVSMKPVRAVAPVRPYVTVSYRQRFIYPGNAKVIATFKNVGDAPARAVEAICLWKDGRLFPLNADLRILGDLNPGESRTAEFFLYPSGGYVSPYAYSGYYAGFGIIDDDKITINGELQTVSYDLKLNYEGKPDTEGRTEGMSR